MLTRLIKFCLDNKLIVGILLLLTIFWGLINSPFELGMEDMPRDPVAVDAIPDIGENQQIVFTSWPGRSPQDVEDQITYPLTSALLGVPGVKDIRSSSMFGFSSIYVIFEEDIDFYWSRSRILEKLNALPMGTLPEGVQPSLGPDATALGQIFWYTLEGRDIEGNPASGWDPQDLRSIQDFHVKYALTATEGVAEVASIGGYVKEYQVDVDPKKLRQYDLSILDVQRAVASSNMDIGARTVEINKAEYFIRGLGYVETVADIEKAVIRSVEETPLTIGDVAFVNLGPATRRGALDKSGAEAVGGVVVARYGSNPMEVIENVKESIAELSPSLPTKTLEDGTKSKVTVVPFYDRAGLINETIGTLEEALFLEILITIIVVILMLMHFRSSIMVAGLLPVAVLMCFIAMKGFGIDANIVALSGIAIAIGTMVDMGIVLVESIVNRLETASKDESLYTSVFEATKEVGSAVLTAVATTVISFLPVFTMIGAEGKLFTPLAYTKTFALIASIILTLFVLPPLATFMFKKGRKGEWLKLGGNLALLAVAIYGFMEGIHLWAILGLLIAIPGISLFFLQERISKRHKKWVLVGLNILYAAWITFVLSKTWMPLGVERSLFTNFLFVALIATVFILFFLMIIKYYERILRFFLQFRIAFIALILLILFAGLRVFQNTGEEFMPALDEGAFLLMPTSMPHSGMEENLKNLRILDMAVTAIPEVETVVGKLGRVESALDPAPISMYENVIQYRSEYRTDEKGHRLRFKVDDEGDFVRDEDGTLIEDPNGLYYRNWRDHIHSPNDIWEEIVKVTDLPGVTSAPKLQPIETRLVMLQTGMRAPMGIKIKGTDLQEIEDAGLELESVLKATEGVKDAAVFADRIVGKPYLNIDIDRKEVAKYGLNITDVQQYIETAIGGRQVTTTVEGRERYAVRIRYPRELRDDPDAIGNIQVKVGPQNHLPLSELVEIKYEQGPQAIKSENGFLVGYLLFDKQDGYGEIEVVENVKNKIEEARNNGDVQLASGISLEFAGNYQHHIRANRRLSIAIPLALLIIFMILFLQFRSSTISMMVFLGVFIAFAGGFILIGLYNTDWFLNFSFFGENMREVFQIKQVYLSVAVWVGFLALFGIATDDGVLVATFLRDSFKENQPSTIEELKDAVVEGGLRRVRPAMMTTATTLLALLPVLSSTGRGSDVMVPMAIPTFGGMLIQIVTMFTVPVMFYIWQSFKIKRS